jgi:hypothetical protein
MAVSLRKRYPGRIEESRNDGPAVASTPQAAARLPEPAENTPRPTQQSETELSPVEHAAQDAVKKQIRDLLAETSQHEDINRQPVAIEPQDGSVEQTIANSGLPPRAQAWLRAHPDYITDAAKNERMQKMHYVAEHQAGGQAFTDAYFRELEGLLGFVPAASRSAALVRQQRVGAPVSAPPSRDSFSLSTGRPVGGPMRLTAEEASFARSLGLTEQQYADNKRKMHQLKASGVIQNGR